MLYWFTLTKHGVNNKIAEVFAAKTWGLHTLLWDKQVDTVSRTSLISNHWTAGCSVVIVQQFSWIWTKVEVKACIDLHLVTIHHCCNQSSELFELQISYSAKIVQMHFLALTFAQYDLSLDAFINMSILLAYNAEWILWITELLSQNLGAWEAGMLAGYHAHRDLSGHHTGRQYGQVCLCSQRKAPWD